MGEGKWWACGCLPSKDKKKNKKDKKSKEKKKGKFAMDGLNEPEDDVVGTTALQNMVNATQNCKACKGYGWWHRSHLPHNCEDDKRCEHCTPCRACVGSGAIKNTFRDCHLCGGNGHLHRKDRPHVPIWRDWCAYCSKCPYCEGMGAEDGEPAPLCYGCDGKGFVHHNPDEPHDPLKTLSDGWCYACETCTGCEGLGYAPLESQKCFVCDGNGFVHFSRRPHQNKPGIPCRGCSLCPGCDGRGCLSDRDEPCAKCKGTAIVHLPENVDHDPIYGNFCIYCTLCKACQNTGVALADVQEEPTPTNWFTNIFGGDSTVECPRCFGYGFHHCVVEPHCMVRESGMARPIPDDERCDDCDDCEVCNGKGRVASDLPLCWLCQGMGFRHRTDVAHNPVWRDVCVHCQYCKGCDGRGTLTQQEYDTYEKCQKCSGTGVIPREGAELIAHDYYEGAQECNVCMGRGMHKQGAAPLAPEPAPFQPPSRARRSSLTAEHHLINMHQQQLHAPPPEPSNDENHGDDWGIMNNPDATPMSVTEVPVQRNPSHTPAIANVDNHVPSVGSDDDPRDNIADVPSPKVKITPPQTTTVSPQPSLFGNMFSTSSEPPPPDEQSPEGPPLPEDLSEGEILSRQDDPEGFAMERGFKLGETVKLGPFQEDLPNMDWEQEILCPNEIGEVVADSASGAWCIVDDDGLLWVNVQGPDVRNGVKRPPESQLADFYCADDLVLSDDRPSIMTQIFGAD